uniref:Uncharacterized protein n=1 Tax=Lotus japonicus TaxID=34305 RepID=I3SS50_LOTJA|nr:unknown [Lotus japonicus]
MDLNGSTFTSMVNG